MPRTADETISVDRLREVVREWLLARGFSESGADAAAEVIVDADLHGVHSHGIRLLAAVAPEIERGTIRAAAVPELVSDKGVTGLIDGHHGFGPVVCTYAADHVLARAKSSGIAAVAVKNSSHWGRPAYYVSRGAKEGLVLVAVSNSAAAMPLWGATVKSVGNNPIAIGVPVGSGGEPLILDTSMQVAAWGRVREHREAGELLPEPWGYDLGGIPTTDPDALLASGRIRPIGNHKGSGLAVMFEALTGGLAASLNSVEVSESMAAGGPQNKSQFFLALDADAFGGVKGFERMVNDFAARSRTLEAGPGHSEVRLPGAGSAAHRDRHLRDGITLTATLRSALGLLGVDV